VTYHTDGDWKLLELHLHVVCDVNIGPEAFAEVLTSDGIPIPGKFDYKVEGINTNEYTIYIDVNGECSSYLIAAHAVVFNCCSQIEETAWGACLEDPLSFVKVDNQNNWALYFEYPACCLPDDGCGDPEPPVDDGCGDPEPPVDDGCGDPEPPVDDGCGDPEPPVDDGCGDPEPPVDDGCGAVDEETGGAVDDKDGEVISDEDSSDDTISLLGVANISLASLLALILTLIILTTLGVYSYKRSRMHVKLAS
jgi:hypothetical protein